MLAQERHVETNERSEGEKNSSVKSPGKMKVAVVFNPPVSAADSAEFVSESGVLESVAAFTAALRAANFDVQEFGIPDSAATLVQQIANSRCDVIANLCESFAGNSAHEPHVAGLYELLGKPYTGAGPECLALTHNKTRTKQLLLGAGISTPEFVEILPSDPLPEKQLRDLLSAGAVIVKPAAEDASLGIDANSVCANWESLVRQVEKVRNRFGAVLVERFVAGREFNVGIIELPELQVLPLAEIQFQSRSELSQTIVTYDGKWSPDSSECTSTPVRCPALVGDEWAKQIEQTALTAYRITGCRDYARIDLRVDDAGNVFVVEVNANPDAGPSAGLARMLAAAGIEYSEFVNRLVEQARSRGKFDAKKPAREPSTNAKIELGNISIRRLRSEDRSTLLAMTEACGMFRADEIEVADELLQEAERDGDAAHYQVWVAESSGSPIGWSCHGCVPLTDATYDLYWIVVAPAAQNLGIGRRLLAHVEEQVWNAGGYWLLAETSSTETTCQRGDSTNRAAINLSARFKISTGSPIARRRSANDWTEAKS
jgi:D-alanine-D-alanine ligase